MESNIEECSKQSGPSDSSMPKSSAPTGGFGCFGLKSQSKKNSPSSAAQEAENSLSLTFISAQGLKGSSKLFGKISPFAVTWIDPSMKKTTHLAHGGGCSPVWNHTVFIPLPAGGTEIESLHIHVYGRRLGRDTKQGSVTIPLSQILANNTGALEYLSCQLLRPSGRIRGLLNLSLQLCNPRQELEITSTARRRTTFTEIDVHAISQEMDKHHSPNEPLSVNTLPHYRMSAVENSMEHTNACNGGIGDHSSGYGLGLYVVGGVAATAVMNSAGDHPGVVDCLDFSG
eukprot:Gb_13888 [translate_table: standard]